MLKTFRITKPRLKLLYKVLVCCTSYARARIGIVSSSCILSTFAHRDVVGIWKFKGGWNV